MLLVVSVPSLLHSLEPFLAASWRCYQSPQDKLEDLNNSPGFSAHSSSVNGVNTLDTDWSKWQSFTQWKHGLNLSMSILDCFPS